MPQEYRGNSSALSSLSFILSIIPSYSYRSVFPFPSPRTTLLLSINDYPLYNYRELRFLCIYTRSSNERLIKRDESTKSRAGFNLRLNEHNFRVTRIVRRSRFFLNTSLIAITPARNTFRIFTLTKGREGKGSLGRLINRPITGESAYPLREIVTRSRDA